MMRNDHDKNDGPGSLSPRPLIVEFPLRGEWRATSTPAERVPSHGTDYFGQRYAFDFVRMDPTATWFYRGEISALARHVTTGIPASEFFCWDEPVRSVSSGRVVDLGDGWPDRTRVHFLRDMLRTIVMPPRCTPSDYRPLAGNYVIVEGPDAFAFYAHLRRGSICVSEGARVTAGDMIGNLGNSGNSTMPHLHFHLMDSIDPLAARGLPCVFREYERWIDEKWETVHGGVPRALERIRVNSLRNARE